MTRPNNYDLMIERQRTEAECAWAKDNVEDLFAFVSEKGLLPEYVEWTLVRCGGNAEIAARARAAIEEAARAHLATPADLSLATEDFPLGRCHRCGEPIADQDKGNEGCEDPHCPTLP